MMRYAVTKMAIPCLLIALTNSSVKAQWGSNGCPPVGGNAVHLFQPALQPFQDAPWRKPQPEPPEVPNYGLANRDGPRFAHLEKYTYNGNNVGKKLAHQLVSQGGPSVPDDSKLPWLVTVSKTQEDKLKAKALLSSLQAKFRIQNYVEGEWYTKDRNGNVIFKSGLTVASPAGAQIALYATPEEGLRDLIKLPDLFDPLKLLDLLNAIRNPNPSPPPGPGPSPDPAPAPNSVTIPWWVFVGAGLLAWMILGGKK